jgi:hypothetical protein
MVYSFNVKKPIRRIVLNFAETSFTQQSSRMLRKPTGAAPNQGSALQSVFKYDLEQTIVIKS